MKQVFSLLFLATAATASAITPLWMRDVRIAPDGQTIAFTYRGDIYTVPAAGGEARRLTATDEYESNPVWSPDSKSLAFASDKHGNFDVYIVAAKGGVPNRLTTHSANEIPQTFSPDGRMVIYTAAIQDPATSALYPTARLTEVYQVPVGGGAFTQFIATPADNIDFAPDGKSMYFEVRPGMENEWRKHHTSSVTGDIWKYDIATGSYTNLTDRPGEDRNPAISPDGKTVYFLSERDVDSFNLYSAPADDFSKAKKITSHKSHPARFLSIADNGTLAYTYDGEIYTLTPGSKPSKVNIDLLVTDPIADVEKLTVNVNGGVPSPNGKMIAFTSRGDVFVTSVEYPSTKQISETAAAERQPAWGDDRTLYYTSERDGYFNIYKATIANDDDPDFVNSTIITEERLFDDDKVERSSPDVSPDGKMLAYVKDRNKLMVRDLKTGKSRQLTDEKVMQRRSNTGSMSFVWSPDSKWIAMEVCANHHDPYTDIALINVETGEMTNLTNSGYTEANPRFVMDGNALLFFTERYGMRAHASWGSQDDVMIVFLNREAMDKFNLNEEDYALYKEAKKKKTDSKDAKENKDKKDDKDKKDADSKEAKKDSKNIVVELDGIQDRIVRLTPFSSQLADATMDSDGDNLYFLTKFDQGYDLWKMNVRKREPKMVSKTGLRNGYFANDKSGKTAFILGSQPKKFDMKSDKLTSITARATMTIDRAAEREAMLDNVYQSEKQLFYRTDMHGVDWDKLVKHYKKFLPHISNNYDYAEFLSELLGELNVSHTGGRFSGKMSGNADRTSVLGLLYDMKYNGDGLKVDEIIAGGPFDKADSKMTAGAIITAVNGKTIDSKADYAELFNNLAGQKTRISFTLPDGTKVDETVKPILTAKQNSLLQDRWVKQRAADVDRWSNGRLGYVHISSMSDDSFRPVYADILGKYNDREGIVIDIRWNGGGRMHEDIEVLFSGNKYFTQVVRGNESCDMPSRRWNKPSIMLQSEACYSNAHGTPWVYQHQGLGKLVGMPVAGTMTSVNWITMQDPTLVFGIPVIGYRLPDGSYLENTQLEPDVKVDNDPAKVVLGEDTQLKVAVETLLKQIDSNK
ncbi:MAG: peptidase S41 [Muribaculaceae bacterium]|nr:peptidase S41 [Muribaculaceae bacterium]